MQSIPLHAENDSILCYFVGLPELPGTKILGVFLPVALVVLVMVIAAMVLLTRRLRRAFIELQASEAQAQHLAAHAVLTGLPNRGLFGGRIDQALVRVRRGGKLAVLLLDLDCFKRVNDTLGHQAGDALIKEFARRPSRVIRSGEAIARVGGDEFAILKAYAHGRHDAETFCALILAAVHPPFNLLGHQMFVGVSIGICLAPEMGTDRFELIRKADIALYHAKSEERNRYCVFDPAMDETVKVWSTIEKDVRKALLSKDELMVHFQPLVAGAEETVVRPKALVRWENPTRGLIPPFLSIHLARKGCGYDLGARRVGLPGGLRRIPAMAGSFHRHRPIAGPGLFAWVFATLHQHRTGISGGACQAQARDNRGPSVGGRRRGLRYVENTAGSRVPDRTRRFRDRIFKHELPTAV